MASATDFFDGYLARRSGQITKFGIILDPIADKFLVISALILLVDMVRLSAWIAIVIIVREFVVTGLRVVALSKDIVIPAEKTGKLKTATQMLSIVFLLLPGGIGEIDFYDIGLILIYIALILALTSGLKYTITFWKNFQ
jgi:CDP-diacylglycerol--glycerol-3-phosphate 3-phosphatidyltransferase